MSSGAQNIKTEPGDLDTAEMNLGEQNMKTGPDAHGTAENVSGRAKQENWTLRPPHRRKRVRQRKHENGTRRTRYNRK
jgi:hypothetical protein